MTASIEVRGVEFEYPEVRSDALLREFTLSVGAGEIVAIRGENGAGKSTLLDLIAGVVAPRRGSVSLECDHTGPARVALVPQEFAASLLPWLTAAENIAIPLRLEGRRKAERLHRVKEFIREIGLDGFSLEQFPHQLSGGQQQRVAVARALISRPDVLLLDEPFANLDRSSVRKLQNAILAWQHGCGASIVLVSHEVDGCIYLADKILILGGRPARLKARICVSLPRPRSQNFRSRGFSEMRDKILAAEEPLDSDR